MAKKKKLEKEEYPLRTRTLVITDKVVLMANCPGACESQFPKARSVKVIGKVNKILKNKTTYLIDFGIFGGEVKLYEGDLDFILKTISV